MQGMLGFYDKIQEIKEAYLDREYWRQENMST